jgi:hypothetical protein
MPARLGADVYQKRFTVADGICRRQQRLRQHVAGGDRSDGADALRLRQPDEIRGAVIDRDADLFVVKVA